MKQQYLKRFNGTEYEYVGNFLQDYHYKTGESLADYEDQKTAALSLMWDDGVTPLYELDKEVDVKKPWDDAQSWGFRRRF